MIFSTITIVDMFLYYRDSVQIDNLAIGVNDFDECEQEYILRLLISCKN